MDIQFFYKGQQNEQNMIENEFNTKYFSLTLQE